VERSPAALNVCVADNKKRDIFAHHKLYGVDDRQCGVCRWRSHHWRQITSGKIAGLANLRDNLTATYQAQLNGMAGALINTFAESDQTGSGPNLPGLSTTPGATSLPTSTTGLAGQIDPTQGGNALLLRDGGISGNSN
jgi:flagellar hook-associated protein FlgK